MSHPADEWFASKFKGAPTDNREIIRAAYDAGFESSRGRTLALCDRVTDLGLDSAAESAVKLVREEVSREA